MPARWTPSLPAGKRVSHGPKLDCVSDLIDEHGALVVWKQLQDGLGLEIKVVALDHDLR
jgi:hypothetical protein